MEINSNNLINKDIFQTNKFDNINSESLKEDKELRQVSNDFEAFFLNQILNVSLKDTAVADNSTGTFGISDMLYDFLSQNNKK